MYKIHRGINVDEFYLNQERNAYYVPNIHYKIPKKVDPVRISQNVKKNLLKDNSMYQKTEDDIGATLDVNLLSKDMELNFSNKNDDDDEIEMKFPTMIDKDSHELDTIQDEERHEKVGEEQKDFKINKKDNQLLGRPSVGRGKMQQDQIAEP